MDPRNLSALEQVKTPARRYTAVRGTTESLCAPLATEDYGVQSMLDVSPPKWHLAHTAWFFEKFVLAPVKAARVPSDPDFDYLFNSYYKGMGPHVARAERGLASRPTVAQIYDYRRQVDRRILEQLASPRPPGFAFELGLQHEQQHQELLLMDIKHILRHGSPSVAYREPAPRPLSAIPPLRWIDFAGGLHEIGFSGEGFSFDNECPRHRVYLEDFRLASRLVTHGEYLDFIADGGYETPALWLSDGWDWLEGESRRLPLYWRIGDEGLREWTLSGWQGLDDAVPVSHLSYYEADAFARWAGKRLPTEAEWEIAAAGLPQQGNFLENGTLHPRPAAAAEGLQQMYGDVWEWTQSPHVPYPKYRPWPGVLAEYNGKFTSNRQVLKGGSCLTPRGQVRASYRNFYPPNARWQCAGLRLAEDVS
ncbi:MAG: ergothioneine biosynthesis protein EgtB [Deltaproteobacteria bacterium]|nr:ergothioneine biosynthesis protein EgtB [Deltaproteobacteria bacterium]